MKTIHTNNILYYIAHNGANIVHYGRLDNGGQVKTGQKYIEQYNDIEEWKKRLLELNVDVVTEPYFNMYRWERGENII